MSIAKTFLLGLAILAALVAPAQRRASADALAIWTDSAQYEPGQSIHYCYSVPAPGPVTILDHTADGGSHVLLSGDDDGTGGCLDGIVTLPLGHECLDLTFGSQVAETCFDVTGTGLTAVTLTRENNNTTVDLTTGDIVKVMLGTELKWSLDPPDAAVLAPLANNEDGVQGVFQAVAPGQVTLAATGQANCPAGSICPLFVVPWQVTVVVN